MKVSKFSAAALLAWSLGLATVSDADESGYRLNAGDVLQISVWKEEELSREVLVRPDGGISFPLVGDVPAANRTVMQVQEAIVTQLEQYVPDAAVTVALLNVAGNKVYVLGKVARPGDYVITSQMDVMQALAVAGGLNAFAAENKIRILRRGPGGAQQAIGFRYGVVKEGRELDSNIMLKSGDVVVVP